MNIICYLQAIKKCGPGVPFTEIGYAIYKHAKKHGLKVFPSVLGHGIGEYFHGAPEIHHTSKHFYVSQYIAVAILT